jgi:hypothetical protein
LTVDFTDSVRKAPPWKPAKRKPNSQGPGSN